MGKLSPRLPPPTAWSVLHPVLTAPVPLSPKTSWSHLRKHLEMSLCEPHLLQKLLPLPGCAEFGRSAAPSLLNSSLSPGKRLQRDPAGTLQEVGQRAWVFPHPWSLLRAGLFRYTRGGLTPWFISPAVDTGSTVSCHSGNIPQAPRCKCWLIHVGKQGPWGRDGAERHLRDTWFWSPTAHCLGREIAHGFVLDLRCFGVDWWGSKPGQHWWGEPGCCPRGGESSPVITHLKCLQDAQPQGTVDRCSSPPGWRGSRLSRPYVPPITPSRMETASAVMCLSAPSSIDSLLYL